jgi:hypothetical protein
MKTLFRVGQIGWIYGSGLLIALLSGSACGQSIRADSSMRGTAFQSGSSFSTGSGFAGESSSYLPFGNAGGFIPYTPGLGGGLGVQSRMGDAAQNMPSGGMRVLGQRPKIGLIRGAIEPLAPIGTLGSSRMGQGGMSGGLIQRNPSGDAMRRMGRPPVGSYPFRVPPSLLGPSSSAPAMSM